MVEWMMRILSQERIRSERLLLKQCHENVGTAIYRFADLSFSREVEWAIRMVLNGNSRGLRFELPEDEVVSLVASCIGKIYELWNEIPTWRYDLKTAVKNFATGYARRYVDAKLRA